jgi:NAD(P)-dependent dehydrogenase (short-subunit alcohol dehydrogenase family)
MTGRSRVAVISGANQGLGFALAEGLAHRLASGDIVYLTGRSAERLTDAATRIRSPTAELATHVLDVRDRFAVAAFAERVKRRRCAPSVRRCGQADGCSWWLATSARWATCRRRSAAASTPTS